MPTTLRNTDILFNDGTTQGTAGGAVNTTTVLNATAGASAGAVGTYVFGQLSSGAVGFGSNAAGSSIGISNANPTFGSTLSGTWKCMGLTESFNAASRTTVWLRIS